MARRTRPPGTDMPPSRPGRRLTAQRHGVPAAEPGTMVRCNIEC
ncbi:MAG: hypothetical protein AVDCRST_MAG27-1239 [uncultured Craurococcus sp.]|uniref:Uncharacterized protein n=1 Tax=uncultured Craurococcus sp. TaxID=1135998 RepID=A0A6J4H020_9PROT|nr:MAG: hypothetical protein AVDCRST_MAG27-1239 [uncultured Craurococcus sp.]